jgi:hypothetical protein
MARLVLCVAVVLVGASGVAAQTAPGPECDSKQTFMSVDLTNRSSFSSLPNVRDATSAPLVVDVEGGILRVPIPETPAAVDESAEEAVATARGTRIPIVADASVARHIAQACAFYGVDADLVACVIQQESGFSPRAVSPKGAAGYMQLMPATARRMGVTDVFDARQNIWAGVRYLRVLLDLFDDDVALALAGYNAGEGRVIRAGYRVPPIAETVGYVRAITARYGRAKHVRRASPVPQPTSE